MWENWNNFWPATSKTVWGNGTNPKTWEKKRTTLALRSATHFGAMKSPRYPTRQSKHRQKFGEFSHVFQINCNNYVHWGHINRNKCINCGYITFNGDFSNFFCSTWHYVEQITESLDHTLLSPNSLTYRDTIWQRDLLQ